MMARSEFEIIEAMGQLPDELTEAANSEMSGWRLIAAKVVRLIEQLIEGHSTNIESKLLKKQYGTEYWYKEIALMYQYGDAIEIDEYGLPFYSLVDASKKIIAQCAIVSEPGIVRIKVARSVEGDLLPLNDDQLINFSQYMQMRMPIGLNMIVVSTIADRVKLHGTVVIFDQYLPVNVIADLKSGFTAYQKSFDFNGFISISDFYEVLNAVEAVEFADITYLGWYAPDFANDYTSVRRQQMYSGYFNYTDINIELLNKDGELLTTINSI